MTNVAKIAPAKTSLLASMAARYGMEPGPFEKTIRATVMPAQHTVEEFAACLMVAHQHGLNPVTREIFFMRSKAGGIQPIVSVDGWATITNTHPQFDGMEFVDHLDAGKLTAITCRMFRKDRSRPVEVTEYMSECKGQSPAWQKTPNRMLRHRAMIQCARYAFGFAGIMEPDEYEQWHGSPQTPQMRTVAASVSELPDIPDVPAIEEEPSDTDQAKQMIASAISLDMLAGVRDFFPDADWNELEPLFDARQTELEARQ